jgi:hypothetical protein
MVDVMIVEVDRLLDQSEAEHSQAEAEIRLRVGDGRGHVVQAQNRMFHRVSVLDLTRTPAPADIVVQTFQNAPGETSWLQNHSCPRGGLSSSVSSAPRSVP